MNLQNNEHYQTFSCILAHYPWNEANNNSNIGSIECPLAILHSFVNRRSFFFRYIYFMSYVGYRISQGGANKTHYLLLLLFLCDQSRRFFFTNYFIIIRCSAISLDCIPDWFINNFELLTPDPRNIRRQIRYRSLGPLLLKHNPNKLLTAIIIFDCAPNFSPSHEKFCLDQILLGKQIILFYYFKLNTSIHNLLRDNFVVRMSLNWILIAHPTKIHSLYEGYIFQFEL